LDGALKLGRDRRGLDFFRYPRPYFAFGHGRFIRHLQIEPEPRAVD
jgi:hypothetical protein